MGILKYRTEAEGWDFYFMMERIEFLIWRQKVMRFPLGDKEFLVSLDVMFEILGFSTRASRILVLQEILGIWTCLSSFGLSTLFFEVYDRATWTSFASRWRVLRNATKELSYQSTKSSRCVRPVHLLLHVSHFEIATSGKVKCFPAIFGVHGIIRAISGFIMHRAVNHSFKISVFEFSPMVLKFVGEWCIS